MPSDLEKARQVLGNELTGADAVDQTDSAAPIPDIPHGPIHQRFASASDTKPYARSKLSSFLDRRNINTSSSPRMLRHFHSSSNIPFGSHTNFPHSAGSSGRASFSFPDDAQEPHGLPRADFQPLRSLTSVTSGQPWQTTLDQSRRSHKLGLAQLVSRRKPSSTFPYASHTTHLSNATSNTNSSHVSTHSLSNRGPPLVPSRLSSLTAQANGVPDETEEEESEPEGPKHEAFESTVPDVAKWFDGLAEPGKSPTTRHKKSSPSQATSIRASSLRRAASVAASDASTFLQDVHSSGSDGERASRRHSGRRHRRRSSRNGSAYTSASSRRGSDAYSDRVVVTRRTKLRDSISRQGSVLSTSDSDESERSRILQIHLPRGSSRSRHHHSPTAEVFYSDPRPSSRARTARDGDDGLYEPRPRSTHTQDDGYESRPRTSRRDAHGEARPRSSRRRERGEEIIEISLPREKSRHSQKSRRPSRASRWEDDADVPPIPSLADKLAAPDTDYKRISDPGPNADYRPPSRQPRHKSSSQSMVAQAVEESIRKRAEADPQYLSVTPAEARLLINMRKKKLAMQKQLFSEGYRHALEEELYQLEQMQATGKNKQARVEERSSFASMPDDVGYLGSQFPTPPNGAGSLDDRPIITDTIMESPSENDLSRNNSVNARPLAPLTHAHTTSRPGTAKRASTSPLVAETPTPPPPPPMPFPATQPATRADSLAAQGTTRASTFMAVAPQPGAPRANSLTTGVFQPSSRTNSMTSAAAAAAAAAAARTKSLTSGMAAMHGRNPGSRDLTKQQGRAVASRQPSWIRRSDEEPLLKYQSQTQQMQQAQEVSPAEPPAAQTVPQSSPLVNVEPSWTAESPVHPDFAAATLSDHQPTVVEAQPDESHHEPPTQQPPQPMPDSWRESRMPPMSFAQHAYTQLKSNDNRPISEIEAEAQASKFTGTLRDSGASSWRAPSSMTADTSEFSSVNGDDTSPRYTLVDDVLDRKRETAVYSPVGPLTNVHARQTSGHSFEQQEALPAVPPELNRSDTVVRVRDPSTSRATTPLHYSLFPTQPKVPDQNAQSVAARRAQFESSELAPQTPEQKHARTAYASPAGSRSSSRVSKLPRMRGSSLPSIPIQI